MVTMFAQKGCIDSTNAIKTVPKAIQREEMIKGSTRIKFKTQC